MDELTKFMAEQKQLQRDLNAAVKPWQHGLAPGDHAYWQYYEGHVGNITDEMINLPDAHPSLAIYVKVLPITYPEDRARMAQTPNRRFVNGYSIVEPTGEFGTQHIAQLWFPLSPEEFEARMEMRWPPYEPAIVMERLRAAR